MSQNQSNKEVGDYLSNFTRREDALRKRAIAVGMDLNTDPWNNWQHWFGDSVLYLSELKTAVEKAEEPY